MSKKVFIATILLIATVSFTIGYGLQQQWFTHRPPRSYANGYLIIESPAGHAEIQFGNIITDIGERYIRNGLGFANATGGSPIQNATRYVAMGNSTIVQTRTKLATEATTAGFARKDAGTPTPFVYSGDYAFNVTVTFYGTGDIVLNATSIHWNPTSNSDGNTFALASLGGYQTFHNHWNATVVWMIVIDAN